MTTPQHMCKQPIWRSVTGKCKIFLDFSLIFFDLRRNAKMYIFEIPHSISTENTGSNDVYINMVAIKVVRLYDAEFERNSSTQVQRVNHIA